MMNLCIRLFRLTALAALIIHPPFTGATTTSKSSKSLRTREVDDTDENTERMIDTTCLKTIVLYEKRGPDDGTHVYDAVTGVATTGKVSVVGCISNT